MRVGRIVAVEEFPEARRPAWKLRVDFGEEIGVRRSSAQITNYPPEALEGRLVIGVVNFAPKQIGPVRSECLVLGTTTLHDPDRQPDSDERHDDVAEHDRGVKGIRWSGCRVISTASSAAADRLEDVPVTRGAPGTREE